MKAVLVFENESGEQVERIDLEERKETKNFKKFGIGKFDREKGHDEIVADVYFEKSKFTKLAS